MAITQKPSLGLTLFSAIFVFSVAVLPCEAVSNSDTPTVYELLPKYGLPSGLFPDSVVNYTLSPSGYFEVKLKKPCYMQFEELLYYKDTITGVLGNGFLTHLQGIEVKLMFFLWYNVVEISVDVSPAGVIYLKVGAYNMGFDVNQFKTVQSCESSVTASCFRSFKGARALQLPVDKAADLSNGTWLLAAE